VKNPYRVLNVPESASAKEVKAAYKKLAQIYHPDLKSGNEEKFKEAQEAYESIRSGTWTPRSSAQPFDSSTLYKEHKHSYVDKNPQVRALVRLVLLWCVSIIALRSTLLKLFPRASQPAPVLENTSAIGEPPAKSEPSDLTLRAVDVDPFAQS
jgi:hypothetical protein